VKAEEGSKLLNPQRVDFNQQVQVKSIDKVYECLNRQSRAQDEEASSSDDQGEAKDTDQDMNPPQFL